MEKILHLYKYVDGVNDSPFPSNEQQATLYEFKYDAKRMGNNAPTITGTIMHPLCLDELWGNGQVYVFYNGERYFIKQTPTSSYSNEDTRYKHEVDFVSERALLNDVYFYDVVTSDVSNDKPVSNSSNVVFYGDIHELVKRLNYSLQYANLEYSVVVDEGITSESKLVSFQKQFFANVLQEGYKLFEIPYYYVGKVIHFGYTNNSIDRVFSQGVEDALLSISKNNITQRIVNRITGVGSADNIPYYYPNFDPKGETEVLYNGSTSNSVSIDNVSKYKKVKLGDTFTYTYENDKRIEYVDKENYEVVREPELVSENYEEFTRRYELAISFPLNVDIATDATLVLGYDKAFLKNFAALVYRGSELVTRLTSLGTYYNFRVKEDYTNITIALTFEFGFNDEKQEVTMDDIPNIVDSLVVSIYSDVQGYEQWSLNKESNKVSLSDYGLKLNSSPTNGDKITFRQVSYIPPQPNLMPPIYRESLGAERFYNALNNTYYDKVLGKYYSFDNPFIVGRNKEDDITFKDIKPSIKGVTNANSERIDMFSEFAWDENDSDEFDEEGNYLHPYFFGKLRRFDGDFGFNLFDHTIEEDEKVISMTSGNCGSCNFVIGIDDKTQRNTVQVDENGNLKRDSNGNVLYGSPQDRQNDTSKYEVWVALRKDIDTFGVIMPNATNNYKPNVGDTFVILHIDLPNAYILASEEKLKDELIKHMANNNSEKFNFSLSFSRIFFAENPTLLSQLNENARIKIAYNNNIYSLYVSSYSYSMSNDSALPEIRVELSEELDIVKESIVKQLANASLYLNQEVKKVNMSVATTNTNVAKNSTTTQVSITQTNARVDDVEKVVRNIQAQGTQSGLNKTELEEYLTTNQYAKLSDIPSLDGYATKQWVLDKNYALASDLTALRTDFDNLNTLLNGNVGGVIDTWNEVVSFLDGYSQSDDLATILSGMNSDIANRVLIEEFEKLEGNVTEIAGYFTNGSANNALKLGGQLPSYYATADALNGVKNDLTSVSNRVQKFENVIDIDDNGDVYIKGTRNFYTAGGTISMFGLGEGDSGEVASVSIKFEGSDDVYSAVEGIITLPAYPSGGGVADSVAWSNVTGKPNTLGGYGITDALSVNGGILKGSLQIGDNDNTSYTQVSVIRNNGLTYMATTDAGEGAFGTIFDNNTDTSIVLKKDNTVLFQDTNYNYHTFLHSGNYSSYALPLSGGKLTGGIIWDVWTVLGESGGNFYLGSPDYPLRIRSNGISTLNDWTILHGGNYFNYALPLSGGTISSSSMHPLDINSTSSDGPVYMYFKIQDVVKAGVGYYNTLAYLTNESNGGRIGVTDDNMPQYWEDGDGNTKHTLIHSGNYSSYALPLIGGVMQGNIDISNHRIKLGYSVIEMGGGMLGAYTSSTPNTLYWYDTIDWREVIHSGNIGSQSVNYANNAGLADYSVYTRGFDYTSGNLDLNNLSRLMFWYYGQQNSGLKNVPLGFIYGGGITFRQQSETTLNGQFIWSVEHSVENSLTGLWFRASNNLGWSNVWKQVAFTDSNVASATKLQTTRYIFGQPFDGTQSVSGVMTGVNTIHFGSQPYGSSGVYQGNWYTDGWTDRDIVLAFDKTHISGKVLIGTTNDNGNKFQIYDSSSHNNAILISTTNGDGEASIFYQALNSGSLWSAGIACGLANQNVWSIYSSNAGKWIFAAKTTGVDVNGNLVATGTIAMGTLSSSSDARLKDNIELLTEDESLAVLRQLRPSKWNWKSNGALSYGFIAQEVEGIASCMVVRMNDEELGQKLYLQYNQLHAFEVGAIQYIDSEVEQLKRDLNTANLRIGKLENELKQYRLCQ